MSLLDFFLFNSHYALDHQAMKFITYDDPLALEKTLVWKEVKEGDEATPPFLIKVTTKGMTVQGEATVRNDAEVNQLWQTMLNAWNAYAKLVRQVQIQLPPENSLKN